MKKLGAHLEETSTSEWVFAAKEGGHLRYDNFRCREWAAAVERAGLGQLGFHSLRHSAAALMINSGGDPIQIQRRLGHADVRITLSPPLAKTTSISALRRSGNRQYARLPRPRRGLWSSISKRSEHPKVLSSREDEVDQRRFELLTSPVPAVRRRFTATHQHSHSRPSLQVMGQSRPTPIPIYCPRFPAVMLGICWGQSHLITLRPPSPRRLHGPIARSEVLGAATRGGCCCSLGTGCSGRTSS